MSDREALLAKRNSNRQEAKELIQSINDLKNSSLRIDLELSQLEIKRVELKKELENMKAIIDRHKSNLAQIPDAIKQKKQELLAKVREGGPSAVASRTFLDQLKKTSNKSQKLMLFG